MAKLFRHRKRQSFNSGGRDQIFLYPPQRSCQQQTNFRTAFSHSQNLEDFLSTALKAVLFF